MWNLKLKLLHLRDILIVLDSVAFNNTGTILASGSYDNTIKLWNVESQTEIATLIGHSDPGLDQLHSIILELFSQVDQAIEQ